LRSDMAKVIVERPRHGSCMRGQGKGYWRDLKRVPRDELPKRERMKQSLRGMTKSLNEHLGPLRRYLEKQVGRPWNKVFAEICANISRDCAVQDHVCDHVFDYVATKVSEIDGVLYETTKWGRPIPLLESWYRPLLYVCPTTGLLKIVKRKSRRHAKQMQKLPVLQVTVDYDISLIRKTGIWYRVRFAPFPKTTRRDFNGLPLTFFDVLQNTLLACADAVHHYGRAVIADEVRLATREEIRKYGEPLKAPNRV
jgi:hypothetical protein